MSDEFERAFVATSYLLGRRGSELTEPLPHAGPAARQLQAGLEHPERTARARVLAAQTAVVVRALEAAWLR